MARRFSGERLAQLRGLRTQTDLAHALRNKGFGTTQTTVSRWETGQEPRAHVLPVLAAELGCTIDELYADEDEEAASMPTHHEMLSALAVALEPFHPRASRVYSERAVTR